MVIESEKNPEIVEKELWDHYSELPNPSWYEYKEKQGENNKNLGKLWEGKKLNHEGHWYVRLRDVFDIIGD